MKFGQEAASAAAAQDEETFSRSRNDVWTGLISNLQGGLTRNRNSVDASSLSHSGNADAYYSVLSPPRAPSAADAPAVGAMRSRYPQQTLRDWIRLHSPKLNGTIDVNETRRYYEQCARLIHTLVLKCIATVMKDKARMEMEAAVPPSIVVLDNIVVQQSIEEGEAAFFVHNETQDSMVVTSEMKYALMKAVGVVSYQLLMGGTGPPISSLDGTERQIIHGTDQAKRPRAQEDRNQGRITSAMLHAGVPYPLCRFTVDLFGGECNGDALFRSDNSFESFNDVVGDLTQMLESPEAFLHLSVRDQWRMAIGEKMHGREAETKIIMDIASRVSGAPTKNDALLEALALAMHRKKKQQVMLVSGQPGAGKSRLVLESTNQLKDQGWFLLCCKFDRIVHAQPLSIVAGAFNEFLEQCDVHIVAKLKDSMEPDDIVLLAKYVPGLLRCFEDSPVSTLGDFEVDTELMHDLFCQLLDLISAVSEYPIVFFLDDLQWADATSIDLFIALIMSREIGATMDNSILFIGSLRDNEADDNPQLVQMLEQLKNNSSIQVTNIHVKGFDIDTLNKIISQSLCLPPRRTRALSDLVLHKTDGIPIHLIEFIQRLVTEKILLHSLVKGWEWDCEVIENFPISNTVAGLFAFKIKSLPSDVLLGLKICSIFGSQIDQRTIDFIQGYDGDDSVDIEVALKSAAEFRLIDTTGSPAVYKFVHDMVSQATFELISANERSCMIQKLANTLIKNATAVQQEDSIIFVAVDLINRIGHCNINDPKERTLYAIMNNRAAMKALTVPDFNSAVKYSENGLLFLDKNHWESQHDLSLELYTTSVSALYSCKDSDQDNLKERIMAVFQHARNLDQEFKTRCIWIEALSIVSLQNAIDECHKLLERLEYPLDITSNDIAHVCDELSRVKRTFLAEKKHRSMLTEICDDPRKTKAMRVLSILSIFYFYQRSVIGGLVCARMVELSLQFGRFEESIYALASFAFHLLSALGDIDEACSCARLALTLSSKSHQYAAAMVHGACGLVLVFKEPIQATLDPLLKAYRSGFDYGNKYYAAGNAQLYVMRSYLSGKQIGTLLGEVEMLAKKCAQFGQVSFIQNVLAPSYNVLRDLAGMELKALSPLKHFVENDILRDRKSNETDRVSLEVQLLLDITHSCFLRDFHKAQQLAELFADAYKEERHVFNHIICNFYVGLAACHFGRQTKDKSWLLKAKHFLNRVELSLAHSVWNFENKYLLLKAECHYTAGEIIEAAKCYDESNISARDHKFVHELALGCELAGYFYKDQDDHTKSQILFNEAQSAYVRWGAMRKARCGEHP